ncbi:MAG: hypothetical protein ACW96X_03905 [Promethearchaeota archaeon]
MHPSPIIILSICTIDDIVYEDLIPRATILLNINNLFELLEMSTRSNRQKKLG